MRKYGIWKKIEPFVYEFSEHNDKCMEVLSWFFWEGKTLKSVCDFLLNKDLKERGGNISYLEKKGDKVVISIDPSVVPGDMECTISIKNLIKILSEWDRLRELGVDTIEINLENDDLSISGDWIN